MTSAVFELIKSAFSSLYRLFTGWTIPGTTLTPMFVVTAPWVIAASVRVFKAITQNAAGGFGEASGMVRSYGRFVDKHTGGGK